MSIEHLDSAFNLVTFKPEIKYIPSILNETTYFLPYLHETLILPEYLQPENPSPNPLLLSNPNEGWSAEVVDFEPIMGFCENVIFQCFYDRLPDLVDERDIHRVENLFRAFVMVLLIRGGFPSCYAVKIEANRPPGKPTVYKSVKILSSSKLVETKQSVQLRTTAFTLFLTNVKVPTEKKHFCISYLELAKKFEENNIELHDMVLGLVDLSSQRGMTEQLINPMKMLLSKINLKYNIKIFANKGAFAKKLETSIVIMGDYTLMTWVLKELLLHMF